MHIIKIAKLYVLLLNPSSFHQMGYYVSVGWVIHYNQKPIYVSSVMKIVTIVFKELLLNVQNAPKKQINKPYS